MSLRTVKKRLVGRQMKLSNQSVPISIKRIKADVEGKSLGKGLDISWSSGETVSFTSEFLRKYCPCAECEELRTNQKIQRGKPSPFKVLKAGAEESTNLLEVWPIGTYAIGILWGDQHSTGIYSFDHLRSLAEMIQLKS